MKRVHNPKRRARRQNFAPYTRSQKSPIEYSADYHNWFYAKTGRRKRYNMSTFKES